ncbi:MAG: hypothetical protein MUC87_20880 [Bacteroidia bacterium]|jgi:hypothetical protein|nr:hypothetical protein [Bacteroidia bacterium]
MTENFDNVFNEYGNAGALFGPSDNLLSNYLKNKSQSEQAEIMKRMNQTSHQSFGSRAEFEKHFSLLPENIREELIKGNLRLADFNIRAVKRITSKTVKLFETSDTKVTGGTSIPNGKLQKGMVLLVSSIQLLAGTSADLTEEKVKAIDFRSIKNFPAIANGEFSLKANKRQIVPEGKSNRCFVTDGNSTTNLGVYKLHNPRLIRDEELIEFVVELGTMDGLDANCHLNLELIGTITTP